MSFGKDAADELAARKSAEAARRLAATYRDRRDIDPGEPTDGKVCPVVYGRQRIAGRTIWWGYVRAYPVTEDDAIIAYRYAYTVHQMICATGEQSAGSGVAARLTKIWAGDKVLFGSDESATARKLDTNDPDPQIGGVAIGTDGRFYNNKTHSGFWGAPGSGGTFTGDFAFYPGTWTQTKDTHLDGLTSSVVGTTEALSPNKVGGFRGFCHIVYHQPEWGEQTSIPELSYEIEYLANRLISGYPSIADPDVSGAHDANPAEVLYDLLTSDWRGLGIDDERVDIATFQAAARTLYNEGNGVSLVIDERTQAREVINKILDQIDGSLYEDQESRRIRLSLVREDYTVGSLPLLDESNVVSIDRYETTTGHERYNQVKVTYTSRESGYEQRSAFAQDGASFETGSNRLRLQERSFEYCSNGTLAAALASRELAALSTPRIVASFTVNRDAFTFYVGQPIRFTWAEWSVSNVVFRVARVDLGTLEDEHISVDVVQDVFDAGATAYAPPLIGPPPVVILDPSEPDTVDGWELPRFFGLLAENLDVVDDADGGYIAPLVRPSAVALDKAVTFDMGITDDTAAADGVSRGAFVDGGYKAREFTESATVETAYAIHRGPYDTSIGIRIENVTDTDLLVSATSTQIARDGRNLVLLKSGDDEELIAFESVTDIGGGVYRLDNVWRGLLDTTPKAWSVGARAWFLRSGASLRAASATRFRHDTSVTMSALPRIGRRAAILGTESSAAQKTVTITSRAQRPLAPANVRALDSADGLAPSSSGGTTNNYPGVAVPGKSNRQIVGGELTITYAERAYDGTTISRSDGAAESVTGTHQSFFERTGSSATGGLTDVESTSQLLAETANAEAGAGYIAVDQRFSAFSNRYGQPSGTVRSRDKARIPAEMAFYRQLLVNPGFDDATAGRGWTAVSGTANYVSDADAFGFRGTYAEAATASFAVEQELAISGRSPAGDAVLLRYKARNMASSAASVRVRIFTRATSGGAAVDTADSGTITPSTAYWDSNTLTLASIDPSALYIAVRVDLTYSSGTGAQGAVDELDLRIAPAISSQLLTNPGFDSALTGWTTSGAEVVQTTTNRSESAGCVYMGNSAAASSSIEQVVVIPAGYAEGDAVHLRWMAYAGAADFMNPYVYIRDSGAVSLRQMGTDEVTVAQDGDWHVFEMFAILPANAYDLQVWIECTAEIGSAPDVYLDDIRLYLYSAAGLSTGVGSSSGSATCTGVGAATFEGVGTASGATLTKGFSR